MSKPSPNNTLRAMMEHWAALELGSTDRLVMLTLWAHADWSTGQNAYPSVATIGRLAGLTRGTIQRALRRAERAGAVAMDRAGGGACATTYRVLLPTREDADPPRSAATPAFARGP